MLKSTTTINRDSSALPPKHYDKGHRVDYHFATSAMPVLGTKRQIFPFTFVWVKVCAIRREDITC